jgi:hypothetical protein
VCLQRQHASGILLVMPFLFIYLFIYLAFSVCSGSSMRQASCGSMLPAIVIYYLLFIHSLFSACSGSMREASCWSCHYCSNIHLFSYLLFISAQLI